MNFFFTKKISFFTESNPGGAETLIFKEPLDKLKSDFKPMNINTSWRSQYDLNVNMPKFAESLSSSMSNSQAGISQHSMMVRNALKN